MAGVTEPAGAGYDPRSIVDTWVRVWAERGTYQAASADTDDGRPRRYIATMYPYPSGDLHMGHAETYSIGDVIARFARLRGANVLHPIGWDSFGLPAENAALQRHLDPRDWTYGNIEVQAGSFRDLGMSFDWRTRLHTSDPGYYRWNQYLFLKMYERGLAYRRSAPVNWCPKDKTVLANEQVIQGRCERCGTVVTKRDLAQWFLRTTAYAQRLLDDMDQLAGRWPDDVLAMQRNWIGRSVGAHIDFTVDGTVVRVFTTRPDTVFGATFFIVAADAPLARELCAPRYRAELDRYVEEVRATPEHNRLAAGHPKTGVPLGRSARNPVTGELIPVYASDHVLADYGTGAIMGVPAHDQRDLEFAGAMGLPVRVVLDTGAADPAESGLATSGTGTMVNAGEYTGRASSEVSEAVGARLAEAGLGGPAVTYRLRDWLVSRQRYWGTPIPIVHCPGCGAVPVPETDLPVLLPESGYELRSAEGLSPLRTATDWVRVDCPSCGAPATRDTDTMDTFVDSSWYFLRYPDPAYAGGPFDPAGVLRWLPLDQYVGGKEHTTGHLIYARFLTKVLHDMGLVGFTEPFRRLLCQGQVIMNGRSMSKSLGNLVNLQEQIGRYGPDAVRVTMLFAGPPEEDVDWAHVSPAGSVRWLARVWRLSGDVGAPAGTADPQVRRGVHRLVDEVTTLMEDHRFNVAVARMMELTSLLRRAVDSGPGPTDPAVREGAEALARMLSCVAPFTAEEAWSRLGHGPSVVDHGWPSADPALLAEETVMCVVQVNGKLRDKFPVPVTIGEDALREMALTSERVRHALGGAAVDRVVVRPPRLVNVVPAR